MSNHASINTHTHAPYIQGHKVQPSATKCNHNAPSPLAAHNHQFNLWDTRAVVGRVWGGTPVGSKTPYSLLLGRLLGRGELGVTVFFLTLPFALLNSSEIKWVWHLRKLQFVIARFSELLIHGNNLVFTIEIIFSKNIGLFLFEFMEQVSVRVMKRIIISYIPHYIQKFLRI